MLKLITLSSSSRGNCHVLEDDNSSIMLDCGIKSKHILPNINYFKLKGILISHSHQDHAGGISDLSKFVNATTYTNKETCDKINVNKKQEIFGGEMFNIDNFSIVPFSVYHDAENFGFLILHKPTNIKILYITDTSNVDNLKFKDIDVFIVEANWDEDWEVKEDDFVKFKRTSSELGHLSLQDTISFLKQNININTKRVFLTHISYESTNYSEFAEKACRELNFAKLEAINPKVIEPREFILQKDLDFNFD